MTNSCLLLSKILILKDLIMLIYFFYYCFRYIFSIYWIICCIMRSFISANIHSRDIPCSIEMVAASWWQCWGFRHNLLRFACNCRRLHVLPLGCVEVYLHSTHLDIGSLSDIPSLSNPTFTSSLSAGTTWEKY